MTWVEAITEVAGRWTEPQHPARDAAVRDLLSAENRFTEESVAFAVNHFSELIASGALLEWIGGKESGLERTVAVLSLGRTPVEGMIEAAAATIHGHRGIFSGTTQSSIPRTFFDEVYELSDDHRLTFGREMEAFEAADAVIATATAPDRERWATAAREHDIPEERLFLTPAAGGVAVIGGKESKEQLSGLAEDGLLHEGGTPGSVAVIFAPEDLEPDAVLERLAGFREEFPPHPGTDGSLAMRAAFLEAAKAPHAVGPGFLMSKDEPDRLEPAHIRWSPYSSIQQVVEWIEENADAIRYVSASTRLAGALKEEGLRASIPQIGHGDAHRPTPGQPPMTEGLKQFLGVIDQSR